MAIAILGIGPIACKAMDLDASAAPASPPQPLAPPLIETRHPAEELPITSQTCEGPRAGRLALLDDLDARMRGWVKAGRSARAAPGTYDPYTLLPLLTIADGAEGKRRSAFEGGEMWLSASDEGDTGVHARTLDPQTLDIEVAYYGGAVLHARQIVRGDDVVEVARLKVGKEPFALYSGGRKIVYSAGSELALCGRCDPDEAPLQCEEPFVENMIGSAFYFALDAVRVVGRRPNGDAYSYVATGTTAIGHIPEQTRFLMIPTRTVDGIALAAPDGGKMTPVEIKKSGAEVTEVAGHYFVLLEGRVLKPTPSGWAPASGNHVELSEGKLTFTVDVGPDHRLRVRSSDGSVGNEH